MSVPDDCSFKMQIDEDSQQIKKRQGLLRSKIKDTDYIKVDYIIVFYNLIHCMHQFNETISEQEK